jgi:hypothetical protein
MTADSEWPDPTYHIGQKNHLHALGVITASYNQLEFTFFVFFMRYLLLPEDVAQRIFALLSNANRIELLTDAVKALPDETIRERLLYFIEGFEILVETRNFLAHSHTMLNDPTQEHLTFGKGSRRQPGLWSYAHMKLEDLRQVADEIRAFHTYGSGLDAWITARRTGGRLDFGGGVVWHPPLPDKPSLPVKLKTGPHGTPE